MRSDAQRTQEERRSSPGGSSRQATLEPCRRHEPGAGLDEPQEPRPTATGQAEVPAAQREDRLDGALPLLRRRVHPAPRARQRPPRGASTESPQCALADPRRPARGGRAGVVHPAHPHGPLPRRARPLAHLPHQHVGVGDQPHPARRPGARNRRQLQAAHRRRRLRQHRCHRPGHPGHRLGGRAQRDLLARPADLHPAAGLQPALRLCRPPGCAAAGHLRRGDLLPHPGREARRRSS